VADWVTISALATAGGTLVLAGATFSSVKSANRAARVAERSLLAGLRPVLMPTRPDDPTQKVSFSDGRWLAAPGGQGAADTSDQAVYMTFGLRNAGTGIAVLHGWRLQLERPSGEIAAPSPAEFTRLTRDLYVPAGDVGFWQGTYRDPSAPEFAAAAEAILSRRDLFVYVLYGDHEGGQRTVSLFSMLPRDDGAWMVTVARHWNIDRDDPR
jgi:hypothetical protein